MPQCIRCALFLLLFAIPTVRGEDHEVLRCVGNPHPDKLPTLGVWREHNRKKSIYYTHLSAEFPTVPDFTCDMWCFESPGVIYQSAREIPGGKVELRHDWEGHEWEIVTVATPHEGAVELVSRLEPIGEASSEMPDQYPGLNVCWQLRRAAGFASEPEPYPEFIRRCFIFTDEGREFLLDLPRRLIPCREADDDRNNPPWVQMYAPKSARGEMRSDADGWADYSDARFTVPMIGAVSRDRKYLTAIASGAEAMVCQAWHDCMHNNARWKPAADGAGKQWRIFVYAIENDPDALLARFRADFPHVLTWSESSP